MRHLLLTLSLTAMALGANGAEPAVKELIVETDWKLTGAKIEPIEKKGEGVTKMVVTGEATLGKIGDPAPGMETTSGKAEVIEYHVTTKKFVLRGISSVTQSDAKGGGRTILGTAKNSVIEVDPRSGVAKAEGPNRVKLMDAKAPAKAKRK